MRVLCVCLGNICRSPTAEGVLRHFAAGRLEVDSAGTGSWHIGKAPYPPAIKAAAERGYDISGLRARQFSTQDFADFDLILAMDHQNFDDIEGLRPAGSETPVRLFLSYAEGVVHDEVPDPYYTGDFEEALDLIETAAKALVASV